jgi:hypothetical protein
LEEAIKGVDVSGFARLRYTTADDGDATGEAIRVSGELNAVVPVADGLAFGTTLTTDGYNFPDSSPSAPTGDLGAQSFNFDKYYFLYSGVKDLAVIGGKYTIPAPWAESGFAGSRGNGLVALYSGVPNWTFAGALYLQTNGFESTFLTSYINFVTNGLNLVGDATPDNGLVVSDLGSKNNLYALGAIGKAGPVDLQFWAAKLEHLIDTTVYAQASFAQAGFNVRAQLNYLKLSDRLQVAGTVVDGNDGSLWNVGLTVPYTVLLGDDAGIFYGLEAGYKNDQFFVTAGYTKTDKDQPIYALDDDNDGFIKFGQQLYYVTTNAPDTATYFLKGGAAFGQFGFELGYGAADYLDELDASELYGLVSYQLAPKFNVELYYSYLEVDEEENSEIQLELKYTF